MKRKFLIIGSILLIVLTVLYFYFKTESKTLTDSSNDLNINEDDFPLKIGSVGENVKKLQRWCNSKLKENEQGLKLNVDGIFGFKTYDLFGWVTAVNLNGISTSIYSDCTYDYFIKNKIYNY